MRGARSQGATCWNVLDTWNNGFISQSRDMAIVISHALLESKDVFSCLCVKNTKVDYISQATLQLDVSTKWIPKSER